MIELKSVILVSRRKFGIRVDLLYLSPRKKGVIQLEFCDTLKSQGYPNWTHPISTENRVSLSRI
jgi:hypothetical protein